MYKWKFDREEKQKVIFWAQLVGKKLNKQINKLETGNKSLV